MESTTIKILKIIGGILAAILLGAIGSGLWERALAPTIDSAYRGSVGFISSIYTGYLDSIYLEASRQLPDVYQRKIAFLILLITASYLIFVSVKNGKWNSQIIESLGAVVSRHLHFYGLLMGVFIFAISYFSIAKFSYVQDIKSYSFQSMEILRPYIGESKYISLRSKFFQVENTDEFKTFNERVVAYSEQYKIKLPEFTPVE